METQPPSGPSKKRILIATLGSLGDLHPCLALGLELRRRGHTVTIASTEFYREKVKALGLGFHPLGPDWDPDEGDLIRQCEEIKRGPEVLVRKMVMPYLRKTYEDLLAASADADFLLAGEVVYPAPIIAEKFGLPWASVILSPCSFFSAHNPSVLVNVPWLIHLRKMGWPVYRAALNFGRLVIRHWWDPVRDLRREVGTDPRCDPMFRDKFSPLLVLALFSPWLAQPQPDWPPRTLEAGYVYYDQAQPNSDASPELTRFLESGDPPIVFTLGSTAVHIPGNFFRAGAEAARRLGRRALLIGAMDWPESPSGDVLAIPYAPYSQVFPRAAAIVHQGGSGTTAQALRAGRPMLIVPFGFDQPDNGARIQRLGAGLMVPRAGYSADSAARALQRLLTESSFARKAEEAASQLRAENGLAHACDAVEALL